MYRCVDKATQLETASKVIKYLTDRDAEDTQREIDILNRVKMHPNLINILAAYRGPKEFVIITD